jgi:hypothetical protein
MTVVRINEECHGFIGIAKDDKSAQNYVIDSWLTGDLYTCVDGKEQTFEEAFGENWKDALKKIPFDEFEALLFDYIWFSNEEVIGSEDE